MRFSDSRIQYMKQVTCAYVTCYFIHKKKYSFFELKGGDLAEECAIVASLSDRRNVSVPADYTEHKVEATSSYWTKRDAKRLPGFYLENKSNMRQFLILHQAVNAAQAGDTVIVNGQHLLSEQLILNKEIMLQGENNAQLGRTDFFQVTNEFGETSSFDCQCERSGSSKGHDHLKINRDLSKQQLRYRGFCLFSMSHSKCYEFHVSTTRYGNEPNIIFYFKKWNFIIL